MPLLSEILEARCSHAKSNNKRSRKKRSCSRNNKGKSSGAECHADSIVNRNITSVGPNVIHSLLFEIFIDTFFCINSYFIYRILILIRISKMVCLSQTITYLLILTDWVLDSKQQMMKIAITRRRQIIAVGMKIPRV